MVAPFAWRLAICVGAVAIVAAGLWLVVWLTAGSLAPAVAPKSPFGTGLREAAPAATGIGGMILAVQAQFYRALTSALQAMKQDGAALWTLLGIGFVYGVFHAAGPGHGKAIIAGYLVASERSLIKGLGLSLAAALLQAGVAILIVGVLAVAIRATAASINATASFIELASFAAVALLGAGLLWRKSGKLVDRAGAHDHRHDHAPRGPACGHAHLPAPDAIDRLTNWRETAAVVLAAGLRPCSGAIVLLVFALAQGLFAAGVGAALAMALGTAITTGALAAFAVLARSLAVKLADGRGQAGAIAMTGLEMLAAAFVFVLGAALFGGLWAGGLHGAAS